MDILGEQIGGSYVEYELSQIPSQMRKFLFCDRSRPFLTRSVQSIFKKIRALHFPPEPWKSPPKPARKAAKTRTEDALSQEVLELKRFVHLKYSSGICIGFLPDSKGFWDDFGRPDRSQNKQSKEVARTIGLTRFLL